MSDRQADREVYQEYVAECRAFGIAPMTFHDWDARYDDDPKAEAQARWLEREERDELDLW